MWRLDVHLWLSGLRPSEWIPLVGQSRPPVSASHHHHFCQPVPPSHLPEDLIVWRLLVHHAGQQHPSEVRAAWRWTQETQMLVFTLSFLQEHLLETGIAGDLFIFHLWPNRRWSKLSPSKTDLYRDAFKVLLYGALFTFCFFFSAVRTSLVAKCTSCVSSTFSPLSALPFSWTTPGSEFVRLSLWVISVVWMEIDHDSLAYPEKDLSPVKLCTPGLWAFCTNFPARLTGYCRRSTPYPCWPGCLGNSASWSHSTSWILYTVKQGPGWECTTALCCLW